jgi:hypothetical protein
MHYMREGAVLGAGKFFALPGVEWVNVSHQYERLPYVQHKPSCL